MPNNRVYIFVLILIIVAFACLISVKHYKYEAFKSTSNSNINGSIQNNDKVIDRKASNSETLDIKDRIARLKKLRKEASQSPFAHSPDENQEELAPYLSEEEFETKRELKQKTDGIYFATAPKILEQIWIEDTADIARTSSIRDSMAMFLKDERLKGTLLNDLECGTKLCKIDLLFPDINTSSAFKNKWFNEAPPFGRDFGAVNEMNNGKVKLDLYFTKQNDETAFTELRERMLALAE